MKITNEPLAENSPVKFIVIGFPVEESIKSAIERFYQIKPDADRNFLVNNEFSETIFTGNVDQGGRIEKFADAGRPNDKSFYQKDKEDMQK